MSVPGFGDQTDTVLRGFANRPPDQVGYDVRDLEIGVRELGRMFGVKRWVGWRYTKDYLPKRRFRGSDGDFKSHGRNAIKAGATPQELVTLLALLAGFGIRGYLLAIEVLEDVRPGSTAKANAPQERLSALDAEYARIFGAGDESVRNAIAADPDYFEAFLRWAAVPRNSGVLGPRTVAIAACASITNRDAWSLRREVKAALAVGVTTAEILEVCSMTADVSVHSLTVGVPIIAGLIKEGLSA